MLFVGVERVHGPNTTFTVTVPAGEPVGYDGAVKVESDVKN